MNLYKNIAKYYDLENDDYETVDLNFYKKYAERVNDNILELGCGTGRISIELAKMGFYVTGIDLSDDMLSVFKKKILNEDLLKTRIQLFKQNIADFKLCDKYGLIIAPGRVFQSLTSYEEIKNSLNCIKKHLKNHGILILDMFQPKTFLNEDYCYEPVIVFDKKVGFERISMEYKCESIDTAKKLVYSQYIYTIKSDKGEETNISESNCLRYYSEEEISNILLKNGFKIENIFGWFDETPVETGREIIIVSKL